MWNEVLAGPCADNPAILGPAGIAHMSVLNFVRWAGWNAGEGKRGPRLASKETLIKLHTPVAEAVEEKARPGTPPGGKYTLGWGEIQPEWAPNPLTVHAGSNMMSLAKIMIDRKRDLAIVLMTNIDGEKADQALDGLLKELYQRFGRD